MPGGGSAAAVSVAMGAALLVMVCNLTLGRKRYVGVQEQVERVAGRAAALRDRARVLAREDEEAYAGVADAMRLPRDTDDQREARTVSVQAALKRAAEPPLETMRTARGVIELARELAPIGNRSAVSDVGSAAFLAVAGSGAARLNVEINLLAVSDEEWANGIRRSLADLGDAEGAARAVQQAVANVMGTDA